MASANSAAQTADGVGEVVAVAETVGAATSQVAEQMQQTFSGLSDQPERLARVAGFVKRGLRLSRSGSAHCFIR